jgi:hypothetical protein
MSEIQKPPAPPVFVSEWDVIRHQGKVLVESQFLPVAINTWQKATAVIMYGKELGIGPMEACQSIDVIQGKPTQKPQSMKAMVHKKLPGAIFRPVKLTNEEAVYEAARPGDPPMEFSFTIKDAERLGLTTKDNWKKQPKVMLSWRCIANVCRTVFPDCMSGVSYTPEELGAEVDDDHNVIVSQPVIKPTPAIEVKEVGGEESEALQKKKALMAFTKKRDELVGIGWGPEDFIRKLNIANLNELLLKDSKAIYAALELLNDDTGAG